MTDEVKLMSREQQVLKQLDGTTINIEGHKFLLEVLGDVETPKEIGVSVRMADGNGKSIDIEVAIRPDGDKRGYVVIYSRAQKKKSLAWEDLSNLDVYTTPISHVVTDLLTQVDDRTEQTVFAKLLERQ